MILCLSKISYKYLIGTVLVIGLNQVANAAISNLDKTATKQQLETMILLDASNLSNCQTETVKKAICLPANTFQSKQGVLASFYNISWAFGTAGLRGSEKLLIFADTEMQRDALLGLFFLAGHKNLWRWNTKKIDLKNILGKGKGQTRSIVRSKYYSATMRDNYLVLPQELESLIKQGWILSKKKTLVAKQTIVFGRKPLDALAKFTQILMQNTENQLLKILIHSPIEKQ